MLSKRPYKGTRDFFPKEKRTQDFIFKKMKEAAQFFAYEPYDGPMLEEVELYKAKSGEELINEQIYSFTDRGKRFVAIRPEMTPTLARMVAQVHREQPKPLRWFSIPNLMRYENPQRGRLREHWQLNCDIFGAPELFGEIEILSLLVFLFKSFGATSEHFEIKVNDRRVVDAIITNLFQLDDSQKYRLYKIIDKSKKISEEELTKEIQSLNTTADIVSKIKDYLQIESFDSLFTFLKSNNLEKELDAIQEFVTLLEAQDLKNFVGYDATIVRGLDYYTGIVFEVYDKTPHNRRALCGGGAYANLLKIFNEEPITGIGFGLGDVTLKDFLETHKLLPDFSTPEIDIFLTFQDQDCFLYASQMAFSLRNNKASVNFHPTPLKIKKAFSLAEKRGATFIGFIGENEKTQSTIQIKNMKTKEVFTLNTSTLSFDMLKSQIIS